jgi:hypothetical protein
MRHTLRSAKNTAANVGFVDFVKVRQILQELKRIDASGMTIAPLQTEAVLARLMELRQLQSGVALRLYPFDGAFVSLADGAGAEPTKHHVAKERGLAIIPDHFEQAGAHRRANFNGCHGSPHCMSSPMLLPLISLLISLVISLLWPVPVGASAALIVFVIGVVIGVAIAESVVWASTIVGSTTGSIVGFVAATVSSGGGV